MAQQLRVAYVVRSWPRLSQTFVLNEILALERLGTEVTLFAMSRADESVVQPQLAELRAPVHHLDEVGARERARAHRRVAARSPRRYLRTLAVAVTRRRLLGGYTESGGWKAFDRAVLVADGAGARGGDPPRTSTLTSPTTPRSSGCSPTG